ncbi:bifunctional DNA-formamidopyrimidine glycosylase/DNA-(apurinic or apyrimidinic site) lyase [Citricoccus sp. GCM10030269]|uniref:bifunctional DNA-formamidopyrimidine glycosylase/DNA-(apurinic or apyrimidinic site) lyase n=1 Tax=Citricoccus sp. GCM10030269 TaxID=3273388 RepID=UPI003615F216
MPELPEVEVVRRGVSRWAAGRTVTDVEVLDARSTRRHDGGPVAFADALTGMTLAAPERRGKYLWIPLTGPEGSGTLAVVVHLGMSGQLLVNAPSDPDPKHLRIRIGLHAEQGEEPRELRFVDQRIFGGMFLAPLIPATDHPEQSLPAPVAHVARDPLDPWFEPEAVHQRLVRRRTGLKRALLDQTLVSGIGNIYADEALWQARLHFDRPTGTLDRTDTVGVLEAVTAVMAKALEQGGTSFDSLYVNVNGESGYFSRSLKVYGLAGQPCQRCGGPIVREKFMNRSSHFCPRCQRRQ